MDFQDTQNNWYIATILSLNLTEDTVYVQFDEWQDTFREWVPSSSPRLAPFRSLSTLRHITFIHGPIEETKDSWRYIWGSDEKGESKQRGIVGLRNLGNTAALSSVLQCLAQTRTLQSYFTANTYLQEINMRNPDGMGGEFVREIGNAFKRIWINDCSILSLTTLKQTIHKFQPRFAGYYTLDASEILIWYLDSLHEELNQILKKPVVGEIKETGQSDSDFANEAWDNFRKKHRSYIVDNMYGQMKGTVVCDVCKRVSRVFDPFLMVSVPVIEEKDLPERQSVIDCLVNSTKPQTLDDQ